MGASEQVNILMVDDQPSKLLAYESILAGMRVNLIKANSGREALEHLLKTEIAIVLMDVSMPEMDGFELAAMIRQHPRYQKTAIIFISAVRMTDLDRLKGYEVGAVDYIPVPVIPEILRAKVSVFAELFRKTWQLEDLNHDLERRVEERTAALEAATNREREARLLAEAAIQVRDDFLSVAAHELKTPLTGLRTSAQILIRRLGRGNFEAPKWLNDGLLVIDQQADRLSRLIEQLFDVSRLDHDKQTAERTPTDLTALTEKLVAAFRLRSKRHPIVLNAEPEVIADVDPLSIEQILNNLLTNAIKYSPDGGQIDVELCLHDSGYARIAVRDRGIGIPIEKRGAIFQRFYQAHAEDHRSGLGLGLYISQQIAKLHGGEITAEFPDDGGTCFVTMLPLHAVTLSSTSAAATGVHRAQEVTS